MSPAGFGERILSAAQVDALAERLGEQADLVLAMGYLGLRWSELAALRVSDVDLVRNRVRIVSRGTEVGGRMDASAAKSRASARQVAIPAFLRPVLGSRVEGKQLPRFARFTRESSTNASETSPRGRS